MTSQAFATKMPSFGSRGTLARMEVSNSYWRKRKQRLEKMLEQFQKTGWKTGGFTVNNCDSLRRRLYQDNKKYSTKIAKLDDTDLLDPPSPLGHKYPVLPGIPGQHAGDDEDSDEESHPAIPNMQSMYNDVFRSQGGNVTYLRQYEQDERAVVLRSHHIDSQAKIGSMDNYEHQAGGGNVKIIHKPLDVTSVKSKVGSLANSKHIAQGGKRKIRQHQVNWNAKSKIGSLNNIDYQPSGGDKSPVFHEKPNWTSIAKVGSLDNMDHVPSRSFRTLQDYMSPFRQRLLNKPNVVWTEGYHQTIISQPSTRLKPLSSQTNQTM